ncbi:hypothetical protein [Clostridium omnivorum]|uniref:Uncharacterized protein n=1 Tax=Clostridium omnivorum TaxID=1604902 RepID=A0ABQ5N7A7_9CLOT|nr:hypothetical protein [Clostridium sp. E14]GLC30925.1 hypothetical protein bsdE14_23350 [Clostridium sp. E14]
MKESNLKAAQQDIEEAITAIEEMEKEIENKDLSKEEIKEKFVFLSDKLQKLESILKDEGILE